MSMTKIPGRCATSRRTWSVTGLLLGALYAIATIVCVCGAFAAGDEKGSYVLLQLPLTPAIELFDRIGLESQLHGLSWAAGYALFFPLTTALLYGIGHVIGLCCRTVWWFCYHWLRNIVMGQGNR